jgi:hypothetical protein
MICICKEKCLPDQAFCFPKCSALCLGGILLDKVHSEYMRNFLPSVLGITNWFFSPKLVLPEVSPQFWTCRLYLSLHCWLIFLLLSQVSVLIKILQILLSDTQFHKNSTQFCSSYSYTQIEDETGLTRGVKTRPQIQGHFTGNFNN